MAVEKLPRNREELRIFLKIKTAKFLLDGGEIRREEINHDMYMQFMELDERARLIKKKRLVNENKSDHQNLVKSDDQKLLKNEKKRLIKNEKIE